MATVSRVCWVGATLSKNGIIEESGASPRSWDIRLPALRGWSISCTPSRRGLRRGQIVLAGSFARPVDIVKGDVIHADDGPLGAIGVSFV